MPDSTSQVLDALPVSVCTTDLQGRIRSANRSWLHFAVDSGADPRTTERSIRGASLPALIGDAAFSRHVAHTLELLQAGVSPAGPWEFDRDLPLGRRHFLMQGSPLRGDDDEVTGALFCVFDVTPGHGARDVLLEAAAALAKPVDQDGVFHEIGHLLRRALRAQALAVWQVTGDSSELRLLHASADDAEPGEAEGRLLGVASEAVECRDVVLRAVGRGRCLAAPMVTDGTLSGALAVYTESFQSPPEEEAARRLLVALSVQASAACERVRQIQRAQRLQRQVDVGDVASGVAQELRHPLFGISSAAQLLRFRAREDVVIEKSVGRILHEVDRLNRLVSSLLDYGRPRPAHFSVGDPDHVWDEVLEAERGLLESRSLTVARRRPPQAAAVPIDRDQLRQAFHNLLVNAAEHAPASSTLQLASAHTPGGGWEVTLTNAGAVVPPEVLNRAFDLFFTTKAGSTGVGLALCRRIVEGHGGRIGMESSSGETRVTVSLPPKAG